MNYCYKPITNIHSYTARISNLTTLKFNANRYISSNNTTKAHNTAYVDRNIDTNVKIILQNTKCELSYSRYTPQTNKILCVAQKSTGCPRSHRTPVLFQNTCILGNWRIGVGTVMYGTELDGSPRPF